MKKTIKIIKYIPIVNFISFFLLVILIPLIYNMKKEEYFKNFIKLFLGTILYVVLTYILSFKNEILNAIIFIILIYILGLYFSIVALQCIEEVEERNKKESKDWHNEQTKNNQ